MLALQLVTKKSMLENLEHKSEELLLDESSSILH